MAKRIMIRKGDIFCVEVDTKFKCYFQYIANDLSQLSSPVIRVFSKHYPMDYVPNLDEIVTDKVSFYAHTFIKFGLDLNLWHKVGNHKDMGNLDIVYFRWLEDIGPDIVKSYKWYIWRLNGPTVRVGEMTEEYWDYDIGVVFPCARIINRIKGGKLLSREIL